MTLRLWCLLGKRCMEEGYSFVWPSGKMPFMITKDGERIDLTIHDNIPYVDLGTYECTPHECHHASKINDLLIHTQDDFSELNDLDDVGRPSRRIYLDGESGLETLAEDHSVPDMSKSSRKRRKEEQRAGESMRQLLEKRKNHLKTANMNLELLTMDLLVMRQTLKMMVMALLKTPLKVMKMTSRSMLSKVSPG